MPAKKTASALPPAERVQKSFLELKANSDSLNEASDKLNQSAANFNAALKPLGLGITSWYEFDGGLDNDVGYSWSQEIGYAKISGKWGLAIRRTSHDFADAEPEIESWPFGDAPRRLRIKAAPHIPDLLDEMIEDLAKTTAEVSEHTKNIDALTAALVQKGAPNAS